MDGDRLEIFVCWPPREASRNRSRAIPQDVVDRKCAMHKEQSYFLTKQATKCRTIKSDGPVPIKVTFHPPNRNRRDLDGCISAMKWGFDGIAMALGVDDSRFTYSDRPVIGEPAPPFGHVVVEVPKP